ncbi:hypothetical protein ONS95_007193 [Cadophora gregata]|uniref:uncharacterized protein n=1 Tax=Cadophora gregata TaxID=51156 RepID=UPI0026DC43A5|nr:uncharacterized protein ONS95_007193 [Cadophora gregata]KAK0100743.1 hypothetical protein ONS95_007193 [Cadophora gregata]KAK0117262.1 hypothetical protein ONS96_013095 [Cadophora gregata f. sp. sojae]
MSENQDLPGHQDAPVEEEEINDRFTTYWSGPYHPDAMHYAYDHNLSYETSGSQRILDLGSNQPMT